MAQSSNLKVEPDADIKLLNMKFDIVEDIPAELESFIFLVRLGRFEEAYQLFDQLLVQHMGSFPVLGEYADMLLEEGRYADLRQLLANRSFGSIFATDEC